MSDFFFQIVLAAISIVIGITVPLLPTDKQKKIAKWIAVATIAIAILWAGYELGVRETSKSFSPNPISNSSVLPTETDPVVLAPAATIQVQPEATVTFQSPAISIGHMQIANSGSDDLILASNQVAIGTADKFQDLLQYDKPPYTIFVVYGEVNIKLSIYWGGWDLWENASESFVDAQITKKIQEVISSHPNDYNKRGYRVVKCYGGIDNCETIITFP